MMNPTRDLKIWIFLIALLCFCGLVATSAHAETYTLNMAIDTATQNNLQLNASREDIAIAQARVTQVWANLLPDLTAEAGYTRLSEVPEININQKVNLPIPGVSDIPPIQVNKKMGDEDNYKAELKLQQLLFSSGAAIKGIKAAKAGQRAADYSIAAQEQEISRQVAEAFYSVLFAQKVFEAQEASLKTAQAHLTQVQTRNKFGAASKYELLRSEVEVANLEPEVEKAKNRVALATQGLKLLMGLDQDVTMSIDGDLETQGPPFEYQPSMEAALANRDDLRGLTFAKTGQEHATWAATAGMLPKAVIFGSYSYQKPWYFEEDWTDLWSVGVGISIPLFDGLEAMGKRREEAAKGRKYAEQKQALIQGIDFTIRQGILDMQEIHERIEKTRNNVQRAEQVVNIAETSYQSGAITNTEVLDAQLALTGARTQYIQALYDYQIARTKLLAATGILGRNE